MHEADGKGQDRAAGQDPTVSAAAKGLTPEALLPEAPPRRRAGGTTGRTRLRQLAIVLATIVVILFGALAGVTAVLASGSAFRLPVWLVADVEDRLNRWLARELPGHPVSVGGISLALQHGVEPVLRLQDVRLLQPDGGALLNLPETSIGLDGFALLGRELRPRSLHVSGAAVSVRRDRDGRFDFRIGSLSGGPRIDSLADLFDAVDAAFATPMLASLQQVEADGLSLRLEDARAGRVWQIGDGRLRLDNRADEVAAEFALSLDNRPPESGGTDAAMAAAPGQAVLVIVSDKATSAARITATVDAVPARDLAAQAAPLAPLGVLDAPISGRLAASVGPEGITALDGRLDLGAGALSPPGGARPIPFDHAALELGIDPARGRVNLTSVSVESRSLRIKASGQAYMLGPDGAFLTGPVGQRLPDAFLAQFRISEASIDPEGLFAHPVAFSEGALDFRLQLDPFAIDIGQMALMDGPHGLRGRGRVLADNKGWGLSLDLNMDEIRHDRLLALWPLQVVPRTRKWLADNVQAGTLSNVHAALRKPPGDPASLTLGYDFTDADVRFIRTLPPIRQGTGYATLEGSRYTMVLSQGQVQAPQGGLIDMAGSVFTVLDIRQKPAPAEVQLQTRSSLTAALSLLDEPPFRFLTRANRPVDLGAGEARLKARLTFPLKPQVMPADVQYQVSGAVTGFASDKLVKNRRVSVPDLRVAADPQGLRLSGPGQLGEVPFDVVFFQPFGPGAGPATVEGTVPLSRETAQAFGVGLPEGMVTGEGRATLRVTLPKGAPGRLNLTSDLNRIGMAIPGTGWSKPPATLGRLELEASLTEPPAIPRLSLTAPGLSAEGSISVAPGGGLNEARFDRVALLDWFRGQVTLTGRGKGRPVGISVPDGEIDLRFLPDKRDSGAGAGSEVPMSVNLSRLVVSEGITLTGFAGSFSTLGGLNGTFDAALNEGPAVRGTVVPSRHGTAVRIQSQDAGGVLAAAGVFASARGGRLDLTLTPREDRGVYDGTVVMQSISVVDAPVLAELLNAVSVVGLLDQLQGDGLTFSNVVGEITVTPGAVEVRRGAATGASLGVTMEGVYATVDKALAFQGVISPVYLVNGIGAAITRRGEGVFGFNYELRGVADRPEVSVNPLSILTPGRLRELFRNPAPKLGETTE